MEQHRKNLVEYCSSLTGYQLSSKNCRNYSSIKIRYSKVSSKCPIEALRRAELEDMTGFLFQSYEVTIEVIDVLNNESFEVQEKERDGRAKHILAASTLNVTCILNTLTAEGYLVEGELR